MNDIDNEIKTKIADLDKLVSKESAFIKMSTYGGGSDESQMIGTKNGYLRFGLELMKGAFLPPVSEKTNGVGIEVDKIITSDSEIRFDWFIKSEELTEKEFKTLRKDTVIGISILVLVIISAVSVLILAFIGLVSILRHYH